MTMVPERLRALESWIKESDGFTTSAVSYEIMKRQTSADEFVSFFGRKSEIARRLPPLPWNNDLFWVVDLRRFNKFSKKAVKVGREYNAFDDEAAEILGTILAQSLDGHNECGRVLKKGQKHNLTFFTDYRAIQVFCWHNKAGRDIVKKFINVHLSFKHLVRAGEDKWKKGDEEGIITYEWWTDTSFYFAEPLIAWETIFPEGIDMEALSPRDTNAHLRVKQEAQKSKPATVKLSKEKDHPPPPPAKVLEPPSSDREHGAVYYPNNLLGKGGFAICYDAHLKGTRKVVALKIVKSHMPQKKMEQKFQTELQIHSKMKHSNIVQFHRAFSYEKCTYIVLELCPNGSLMDMVKKRKYVTEPEVRFWTVQMAGAIKYMHGKSIIHRDLKMGNIFLDKHMNVKIGDFGLAALLMSGKDWQACRRTTLCGTPNYIAPEILSKDKSGHDHAVDIWSLGIIIFAMLTGKPPFQSTTADEIYRRARERDYDWPKMEKSENFISEETKDLVAQMLQAPEERPDPDTIVQHPFFTCGPVPQSEEMAESLKEKHPDPGQFLALGVKGGKSSANIRNLKKVCVECGVGPWSETKRHTSTYRECADEEKAGLTPVVPLADDVVYRPFSEWLEEQAKLVGGSGGRDQRAMNTSEAMLPSASKTKSDELSLSYRPSTQSFAAQQRVRPVAKSTRQPPGETSGLRPVLNTLSRTISRNVEAKTEEKTTENTNDVEGRIAVDIVQQLSPAPAPKEAKPALKIISSALGLDKEKPTSLFNSREKVELIPKTEPGEVLEGLRLLQAELERALNSRSMAVEARAPPPPTIVVKWVDYTNKFGLGYILSNGSVGCIFRRMPSPNEKAPKGVNHPSCIVVRQGEKHLISRGNKAYRDRNQLVPMKGPNIEFYENRDASGIFRGTVAPSEYRLKVGEDGELCKLGGGADEWDDRRRERVILWKKFSNYMTQYSRDSDFPTDDALKRTDGLDQTPAVAAANVVTFYQRFGDVGCWGFCDGHFQFNFPDHTKIVISADGTWCDFYHLPLEAARDLSIKGTIPARALDDRQHLSYPLQTLLNFMSKPKTSLRKRPEISHMLQGIPQANDFRKKIEFIRLIVKEWITKGGLGLSDMTVEGRLRWNGNRERINVKKPYKHVWVAVGGRGRDDDRKVAWFDPAKPEVINPDIEAIT